MDGMQIERTIRSYMPQIIHMTLATVNAEGKPWACEVHYAFDDELNLYWVSMQDTRHSREIAGNPNVSGTIVVQHFQDQMPRGLAFEGTAEVLEDVGSDHLALKTYAARFPARASSIEDAYKSNEPNARRIYKVTVSDYYLIDGIATGRIEKHHLSWNGSK